jgi:RNA polymerase sigma-70 factor (ECF subfamily)
MKREMDFPKAMRANEPEDLWQRLLEYKELVFRICLGMCRNTADADDMAQEAYCKAFAQRGRLAELADEEHEKLWLCRVARTTCLDHLRKMKVRSFFALVPKEEPKTCRDPEAVLIHSEEVSLFRAALARLPRKQRDALVLKEYGQLSYREIAAVLGIKEGTVMSTLLRARRRVHAAVREALHES